MPSLPSPECLIELGEPPSELKEYAREHCGEDPSTRLQAVYELREMIYERGECTPHRMDDEYLIKFLRVRNFIPQRAHRLIVQYYQFMEDNPELFDNVYPLDLKEIGAANIISVPPYKDQNGRRLIIYRVGCWDTKKISVDEMLRGAIFTIQIGGLEPRNQILGGVAIFDLENIGTQHAWQMTPSLAAKLIKIMVTCLPVKAHAIHMVNHSWLFDKTYNVVRPFLTEMMSSRIHFHGYDMTSLHKHIKPEHLPERYGGVWPEYPYTVWLDSLKKKYDVVKAVLDIGYKFREEEVDPDVVKQLRAECIELS